MQLFVFFSQYLALNWHCCHTLVLHTHIFLLEHKLENRPHEVLFYVLAKIATNAHQNFNSFLLIKMFKRCFLQCQLCCYVPTLLNLFSVCLNRCRCYRPSTRSNLCVALLSLLGPDRGKRRCCPWASQGRRAMSCVDQRRWRQRPPSGPSPSPMLSTARSMWSMSWANLQPRRWLMHAGMVSGALLPPAVGIDHCGRKLFCCVVILFLSFFLSVSNICVCISISGSKHFELCYTQEYSCSIIFIW